MSYADQVFISMCEDILENGTSTEERKSVRTGQMESLPIRLTVWCCKSLRSVQRISSIDFKKDIY